MTPNVLVMWGGDFSHYAPGTFDTLDILMDGVRLFTDGETKLKDKYEIVYSTISEYFASVREDSRKDNIQWDGYNRDFWEYDMNSNQNAYWTGYFSTYPDIKKAIRRYSDYTEAWTQIKALDVLSSEDEPQLIAQQTALMKTLGIMQHHDAITGTHTHEVGLDYERMMSESR